MALIGISFRFMRDQSPGAVCYGDFAWIS